jgi:hypothetical protein
MWGEDSTALRLDCDLESAVAQFPAFWEERAPAMRLALRRLELPAAQFPRFTIDETLRDQNGVTHTYERANVEFSRSGWDDPDCTIQVHDWGKSGWSHFYPDTVPAISPDEIRGIPKHFAAWLKCKGFGTSAVTMADAGRRRGPTVKTQERAAVFKRLKDEHPAWSQEKVAMEAREELGETVTGETVRNAYKAMGWVWQRADRIR